MEERLLDLKCPVFAEFAQGGMKGEGLMAGIVAQLNDTNRSSERPSLASPMDEAPTGDRPRNVSPGSP